MMTKLEQDALNTGHLHGLAHADYVNSYGGDLHATPDIPNRFKDVATYYTAAYADGVQEFIDDLND